jgi:hypothetical protein
VGGSRGCGWSGAHDARAAFLDERFASTSFHRNAGGAGEHCKRDDRRRPSNDERSPSACDRRADIDRDGRDCAFIPRHRSPGSAREDAFRRVGLGRSGAFFF